MRWAGTIGFTSYAPSTDPARVGICDRSIKEYPCYGDIYKNRKITGSTIGVVEGVQMNMNISIIADQFVTENYCDAVYLTYMGQKWKITDVTPEYPRLTFAIGGRYCD